MMVTQGPAGPPRAAGRLAEREALAGSQNLGHTLDRFLGEGQRG